MNPIELFAWIAVVLVLVKVVVILINPKAWMKFAKTFWERPIVMMVVSLVLAIVVLTYLLESVSIIQIFAVLVFVMLISAVTLASYSKEFVKFAEKLVKDRKFFRKAWVSIVIWVALAIWALIQLI
mgnify:CR=1 FL=1|jgi:hypothetical protein